MTDSITAASGSGYWRSLGELHGADGVGEQKAHEFMAGVTQDFSLDDLPSMSRKKFLALLSASAAFAASGCTNYRDKGEIVPYTRKPEEITPGVANAYASTCTGCAQRCGILVKTREGRPVKIDGNPDHPVNRGKICATGQAAILNLYDPARLKGPARGSSAKTMGELSWKNADAEIRAQLAACTASGREIAIVSGEILSPTAAALLAAFAAAFPTTRRYVCELFHDHPRRSAWRRCYGTATVPSLAWERTKVIVALESDFLGTEGNTVAQIRGFAAGRDVMEGREWNRLYCIEASMSLTGANADYRMRLRPDAQYEFLLGVLHELSVVRGAVPIPEDVARVVRRYPIERVASEYRLPLETIRLMVGDLAARRGEGMIHAGDGLPEQVHVLVNYLNDLLGNTSLYDAATRGGVSPAEEAPPTFPSLIAGMKSGEVGMVIHFGANPVFHLPRMLGYADALASVPVSVSFVESEDETAALCSHVLASHSMLESWGDYAVHAGLTSLQQPVIAPLYDTRQKEAVLLSWIGPEQSYRENLYHEYLMKRWETVVYPAAGSLSGFREFWHAALHDGVRIERKGAVETPVFSTTALGVLTTPAAPPDGFVVILKRSHFLGDGSFANNGWLQEVPHPVSKVVWDNYAAIAPATAARLGVRNSDLVEISLPHGKQRIPVFLQPGQAEDTVTLELGYGRWNAGPIGTGVGADVQALLADDALTAPRIYAGATVTAAGGHHELASTQEHHALDDAFLKDLHLKRDIIREGTVMQYEKDPDFLRHHRHELFSISKEVEYNGLKWAMAIDLNKCVGCNACVTGCDVENNIPVVGKDQVARGREMQWIRIDRYYSGSAEDPRASHQPMLCQHCDQAPCENVCPVVATTHSPDGLNQMTYNRCVGTKYCSNNCPYKVRRFNFYDFRRELADGYYQQDPVSLVHNPEVTVRSRGVMEKCTFCIQRIAEARQHAAEGGAVVTGSDVRTACQEACPATAIIFGDMNDPGSEISRYRNHALGYHVLEEVNARPNVTYLARLRNVHTETLS